MHSGQNPPNLMENRPPPHYTHVNPAKFNLHWNQAQAIGIPASTRGNVVHVNPAFLQSKIPLTNNMPNSNRIIVNPKFFPHVQNEMLNGEQSAVHDNINIKPASLPQIRQTVTGPFKQQVVNSSRPLVSNHKMLMTQHLTYHAKPSPIKHVSDRNNKLSKLNTNGHARSKYKWRKTESPLKSTTIKQKYKLIRLKGAVNKSQKMMGMSNRFRSHHHHDPLKMLTPPKLTSTPIETRPVNTRFKLDNRGKSKKKVLLPKILQTKYRLIRSKISNKPVHVLTTPVKFSANRSIVHRNFSNFKSPLSRPLVHRKLLRLVNAVKTNKNTTKKTKSSPKKKTRKRYYDDSEQIPKAKAEDEVLGCDVEIAEKPVGSKIRAPIGILPSFITL